MTTKTSKKTTAAKKTTTKVQTVKTSELADGRTLGPSLADIVNGTSPAVAKAVAEKRAKVEAEKPAEPAKKATAHKGGNGKNPRKGEKTPKAKEAKEPRATSGALIKQMILAGDDAETILAAVHKAFPDSAATKGDVSWNRWDLKRKGLLKG